MSAKGPDGCNLSRFSKHEACLGVLLLLPGQDASLSQVYSPLVYRQYPFKHLGNERHGGVKFCLTKQLNGPGLIPRPPDLDFFGVNRLATPSFSLVFFFAKCV